MISNYVVDRIKYTVEIMEYMDKHLTLKYKDLIRGIEQDLLFPQRNVERYLKTSTGWAPKFYYERRKLNEVITKIKEEPKRINTICRKFKYGNKKELNRKCKVYFDADLDEIINDKDDFNLQEKASEEEMLKIHMIGSDFAESIKLTQMGEVRRIDNVYKIKFTLDKMPVYMLSEMTYSAIKDDFKNEKFDRKGFLLRIAVIDKSIKENTNFINFDERENEIINYCYLTYDLLNPINIDGICYVGINKKVTYRYLQKNRVENGSGTTESDIAQQIKVRYLGSSGAMNLKNNDKLIYHFFTKDLELDSMQCPVDYYIDLKESEVKNIIEKVYDKYKNQPVDLNGFNACDLSDELVKGLNRKINTFRYGEIITVNILKKRIISINDFYPKAKIIKGEEILFIIENLINKIENIKTNNSKLDENIMASGYEVINKIIRFSKTQPNQSIAQFVNLNFKLFDTVEDLFVDLTYVYVGYINDKLSENEAVSEYRKILKEIYPYRDMMKELYNKIKE